MTKPASKNAQKKRGKPFEPGHPGGPGRPEGSRNKATVLLDQLAEGEGEAILRKVIEAAKAGDMRSAEIILSRLWPVRKGRPVSLQLPSIETATDIVKALGVVAGAVSRGEITAEEGAAVATVLETKRKALETSELEARISALEKEKKP
jgi:hypothetical protein